MSLLANFWTETCSQSRRLFVVSYEFHVCRLWNNSSWLLGAGFFSLLTAQWSSKEEIMMNRQNDKCLILSMEMWLLCRAEMPIDVRQKSLLTYIKSTIEINVYSLTKSFPAQFGWQQYLFFLLRHRLFLLALCHVYRLGMGQQFMQRNDLFLMLRLSCFGCSWTLLQAWWLSADGDPGRVKG